MEEELDIPDNELEDLTTEEESRTDELDNPFALELETTSDELEDLPTEEESGIDELENAEEELSPSDSELLFPLSPLQAVRIRATATYRIMQSAFSVSFMPSLI